jgi:CRISPR/Cas system-associated exonuclease Cas4 (RecB family)
MALSCYKPLILAGVACDGTILSAETERIQYPEVIHESLRKLGCDGDLGLGYTVDFSELDGSDYRFSVIKETAAAALNSDAFLTCMPEAVALARERSFSQLHHSTREWGAPYSILKQILDEELGHDWAPSTMTVLTQKQPLDWRQLRLDSSICFSSAYVADDGFRIKEEVDAAFTDANKESYTRGIGYHHPSALGSVNCARALGYERAGVLPAPNFTVWSHGYFELGHLIHNLVQGKLYRRLGDRFQSEVPIQIPSLNIGGSADGVIDRKYVLEIKTIGAKSYSSLRAPKRAHIDQVHLYMMALNIPRALILYVNRDNLATKEFFVRFDAKHLTRLLGRIAEIENKLDADQLPDREVDPYDCGECKYAHVCRPQVASKPLRGGSGTGAANPDKAWGPRQSKFKRVLPDIND